MYFGRQQGRNQTKTLLGIETPSTKSSARITKSQSRNQTKTLLGIETLSGSTPNGRA